MPASSLEIRSEAGVQDTRSKGAATGWWNSNVSGWRFWKQWQGRAATGQRGLDHGKGAVLPDRPSAARGAHLLPEAAGVADDLRAARNQRALALGCQGHRSGSRAATSFISASWSRAGGGCPGGERRLGDTYFYFIEYRGFGGAGRSGAVRTADEQYSSNCPSSPGLARRPPSGSPARCQHPVRRATAGEGAQEGKKKIGFFLQVECEGLGADVRPCRGRRGRVGGAFAARGPARGRRCRGRTRYSPRAEPCRSEGSFAARTGARARPRAHVAAQDVPELRHVSSRLERRMEAAEAGHSGGCLGQLLRGGPLGRETGVAGEGMYREAGRQHQGRMGADLVAAKACTVAGPIRAGSRSGRPPSSQVQGDQQSPRGAGPEAGGGRTPRRSRAAFFPPGAVETGPKYCPGIRSGKRRHCVRSSFRCASQRGAPCRSGRVTSKMNTQGLSKNERDKRKILIWLSCRRRRRGSKRDGFGATDGTASPLRTAVRPGPRPPVFLRKSAGATRLAAGGGPRGSVSAHTGVVLRTGTPCRCSSSRNGST